MQCLARGGQDLQAWRGREQGGDDCCRVEQMLEIIENQQQGFIVQEVEQLLLEIPLAVGSQAHRLGDRRNQQIAAREWLQRHEHRAL